MRPEPRGPRQHLAPILTGWLLLASSVCPAQSTLTPASRVTPVTVTVNPSAPTAASPNAAHEQQLQAIRQALVEATLQTAPTQVISSSWIDSSGALRETHEFNAKAEVRGIRLVRPEEDSSQTAKVSVEVLPWGWRRDGKTGQECPPAPRQWRLPLRVSAQMASGVAGPQLSASQTLLSRAEKHMHNALHASMRWTALAPVAPAPSNSYLRALGKATETASTHWQMNLVLEPLPPSNNATVTWVQNTTGVGLPILPTPAWQWVLHLSLQNIAHPSDTASGWRQDILLNADGDKVIEHPTQWLPTVESSLVAQLGAWVEGIDKQLQCEPTSFAVRYQGNTLVLLAGQGSGLRPGDRVLLMQPGWVPSRMLDPRAADHLALAEVERVGIQQSALRPLAGPPLPQGKEWVALPL